MSAPSKRKNTPRLNTVSEARTMEVVTRCTTVRDRVRAWHAAGEKVALVPTMGNLHKGHLSLVAEAQERADHVIVSVFVNPLQFGPNEDFERYPRTLEADRELLANIGTDMLFAPPVQEMYPLGHEHSAVIDVPEFATILEGAVRPGHFLGVATVVAKLFNVVGPDLAMFGEKDFQQLLVIRRMVSDLFVPIEVIGLPIMRDHDGLALSSRNRYLSSADRQTAPALYAVLKQTKQKIDAGARNFAELEKQGTGALFEKGFTPDYLVIRRAIDLGPPDARAKDLVILVAARLPSARLLDNLRVRLVNKF
jgi:pantoate--beta-alanine ligase